MARAVDDLEDQSPKSHVKNGLLHLPPEIRILIYRYALIEDNDSRIQLRNIVSPPLLSTSRQLRQEASPVFFSEAKFVLTVNVPPSTPRIHRVLIPPWIQSLEQSCHLHMRNVKVEIDYAFRWVVVAMAQRGGRLQIVEAWLHNGRQKLPIAQIRERVGVFLDWTMEQKTDVSEEVAGLSFREVVLIAGKMCQQWAGSIVPGI